MNFQADTAIPPPDWSAQKKWGTAVEGGETGYQVLPDVLVKGQRELGLNATEMVVLLNILVHWWTADNLPHPRPSSIARRMDVTTRTVERAIQSLERKGLVKRLPADPENGKPSVRRFDLSGLVRATQRMAEQIRKAN